MVRTRSAVGHATTAVFSLLLSDLHPKSMGGCAISPVQACDALTFSISLVSFSENQS